jgi:hypothetical protein
MRVIVFLVLIVALFALHLQEDEEDYYFPSTACLAALNEIIGYQAKDLILVSGKNFFNNCKSLGVIPNAYENDNTCTLFAGCTFSIVKSSHTWDIKDAAKKICCPTLN